MNGAGSRGGNVRDLDTARELQGQVKDKRDWRGAIDEQIRRTLLETGYFHADDLDALCIPPEHAQLKGTRSAWFRNQGYMEKTGDERKVAHEAANGRKAPIHRITLKGRELTAGVDVSRGATSREAEDSSKGAGIHPGEQSAAGVDSENREGSAVSHKPGGTLDRPVPVPSGVSTGARPAVDPGGAPDVPSQASGGAARQLQEGRDRQVRGAGSGEDRSASPINSSASARAAGADNPQRKTQPARPLDDYEPLSLLPEPDPELWAA